MDAAFWITTVVHGSVVIVLILILQVLSDVCYALTALVGAVMNEHRRAQDARDQDFGA